MSLIVLAIAAAHALPPIIGGVITRSKGGIIGGAIVGALIGAATGNPVYAVADWCGVAVGTWIAWNTVPSSNGKG